MNEFESLGHANGSAIGMPAPARADPMQTDDVNDEKVSETDKLASSSPSPVDPELILSIIFSAR